MRRFFLLCGLLSTLVYAATDVVGGHSYDGYSFVSQAISELMARGAPSERIVDPLFLLYDVLIVAFGAAVFRDGGRRMQIVGSLILVYGIAGVAGPTLAEMQPRGTGVLDSDLPHIILTAVMVLLLLATIGLGAFTLGSRFRLYSFCTLVVVIVFGAIAARLGAKLAAGEPTPGFGVIERVNVYSALLWHAMFSLALLRRPRAVPDGTTRARQTRPHP